MSFKRKQLAFIILLLMLPCFFVLDLLVGNVTIPLDDFTAVLQGVEIDRAHRLIIFESRLPKALTAILCGSALAISGLLMQTLFRNPLAGPYILGISSGAGLGVAILVMGTTFFGLGLINEFSLSFAAIFGATSVMFILFLVSFKVRDVMTLLILGVMIGAIATAIIGLIQYFTSDYQLKSFIIWTLGSLSGIALQELWKISILVYVGIGVAFLFSKNFNALLLGEEYAQTIGIPVMLSRLIIILISGLLAGIITAYCGPIGFVGIVVPHLARLLFQSNNHFTIIPASLIIGALMLLISDILSSLPAEGLSLPINSITSILGIPLIIWVIFSKRKISSGF